MFEDIIGEKKTGPVRQLYICIVPAAELWNNCGLYQCSDRQGNNKVCDYYREKGRCASKKNPSENRIL